MRLVHRGEYPAHWPVLAEAVKRAAGDRCIRCGHPRGDSMKPVTIIDRGTGLAVSRLRQVIVVACDARCTHPKDGKMRVLTVHHMTGDKSNDYWWNLLSLCQICHLVVQAKVIPERPYLFEHTDWFKPYVAGYYAFTLRGLEMNRAQIEWALEKWIRVGQPWLPIETEAPTHLTG